MRRILTLAFVLALIAGAADAAKPCRGANGQFIKCPTATAVPACVKGKLCGHSCIAKSAVCHQPPIGVSIPPKVNPARENANPPH
jgi:hypothetical protein